MLICSLTQKIENWASKTEFLFKIAKDYYQEVVQNEVILANITSDDNILCIGGGICPFTAILFHQVTGAKVRVIDNNSCCVNKARQIIDRMGFSESVKTVCQDGSSAGLSFAEYTVVHFALQVSPMECVFSNVESRVAPSTKLLVRRPKKQLKNLYSHLPNPLLHSCPLTTHKKARNIGSTLLYIKQEYIH